MTGHKQYEVTPPGKWRPGKIRKGDGEQPPSFCYAKEGKEEGGDKECYSY